MELVCPEGEKTLFCTGQETLFCTDITPGSRTFVGNIVVNGDNADVTFFGKVYATEKDKKEWKISLRVTGKNSSAKLFLNGIADGSSHLLFSGAGTITAESEGGRLEIHEKIVIFSPTATAEALPLLRVETENVSGASHSASITPFSEELLFFLASRGVAEEEGKELLKNGILGV